MEHFDIIKQTIHDLIFKEHASAHIADEETLYDVMADRTAGALHRDHLTANPDLFENDEIRAFTLNKATRYWDFQEARKLAGRAAELQDYITRGVPLPELATLVHEIREATESDIVYAPEYVTGTDTWDEMKRTSTALALFESFIRDALGEFERINRSASLATGDTYYLVP